MCKVALATPHGGKVSPDFYRYLLTMQAAKPEHQYLYVEVDTMIIGKARNMLTSLALQEATDVIWFIDDDVLLPEHAGILIDQAMQLGVVSGLYFNRRPPFTPQVYRIAREEDLKGYYWPVIDYPDSGIREEDAVGAGCLCVRADVFRTLQEGWNQTLDAAVVHLVEPIRSIVKRLSPWFEFLDMKGEDLYFSERLKEAGIPLYVNYDVKCAHRGDLDVEDGHFRQLKEAGLLHIERTPL